MKLLDKMMAQEDINAGLHTGEAYILWTQVHARYDTLELAEMFMNLASDSDLKTLIDNGISKLIKPQIKKLEETMTHYRLPLPPRPPMAMNYAGNIEQARDEWMFRIIFAGSQTALNVHIKAINICINDSLRNMFMNFLNQELHMYDNMVKYGKIKGWVYQAPRYTH